MQSYDGGGVVYSVQFYAAESGTKHYSQLCRNSASASSLPGHMSRFHTMSMLFSRRLINRQKYLSATKWGSSVLLFGNM